MRDEVKAELWRRIIQEQAESGMGVRAWCRKHRVREAGFYWWRRELKGREVSGQTQFVPVRVTDASGETGESHLGSYIAIVLAGGRQIHLYGQVDRQVLADVLAVVEGRAC